MIHALVLVVALLGAPTHTPTPTMTPTSTPTATTVPSATATASPSPSPTVAHIGSGGGGGSASCPSGIFLPVPFTGGWCLDPWTILTSSVTSIWNGLVSDLEQWMNQLTTAILGPLMQTTNPADNPSLGAIYTSLAGDATYVFAVLVGLGALWSAFPAMFGRIEEGMALLTWSAGVLVTLHAFPLLLSVWIGAVNGLSADIGTTALHDMGHATVTLILAPLLLFIAGLERAISIHVLDFLYEVAPLAIVCFVWPPARGIGVGWLRTFLYLSLLGPAYTLMVHTIAAVGGADLWGQILMLGGLLVLDLVPGIVAALFSVAAHAGMGSVLRMARSFIAVGG